jgi:hypothetical protein
MMVMVLIISLGDYVSVKYLDSSTSRVVVDLVNNNSTVYNGLLDTSDVDNLLSI